MTSMANEGTRQADRSLNLTSSYLPNNGFDNNAGGTLTSATTEPTTRDFENVFGPVARDIKDDLQRYKRHGRWHLPDILKGPNPWLADRVDGLITDATNSPFTSTILPYRYFDNVDGKLKWNVWSFDEAMPSRVPYEAAARTLTQTKRSYSAYAVRHGLAITLEHNFMMTPQGRENFNNQLKQLVGSIQYANDLDVHMALILAPSYEKKMMEKYNNYNRSPTQTCREYVDLFGFMQKNQNGLDILIEEAKLKMKLWGSQAPNFMLTNSKLTFQLTMTPERTNYITQGIDGIKRLRQGPDLQSYRGVSIIPSRSFSMETGQPPRDIMRRRVRVAEYYRILPDKENPKRVFELYNEERDTFFSLSYADLFKYALMDEDDSMDNSHKRLVQALQAAYNSASNGRGPAPQGAAGRGSGGGFDYGAGVPRARAMKQLRAPASNAATKTWTKLLHVLNHQMQAGSGSEATAVVIPADRLLATPIVQDGTAAVNKVFSPMVAHLHFQVVPEDMHAQDGSDVSVVLDTDAMTQKWPALPPSFLSSVQQSMVPYPRTSPNGKSTIMQPAVLRNPFTCTECKNATPEYHEARVGLARMFRRYATPASFVKVASTVANGPRQLVFNKACLQQDALHVGQMFYQPLGAFCEPNHPIFHENIALGKNRDVHSGWILTEDVLDYLVKHPERWEIAAQVAAQVSARNMTRAQYSCEIGAQMEQEFQSRGWAPDTGAAHRLAMYTWGAEDNYLHTNDYLHPSNPLHDKFHKHLRAHAPHAIVTNAYLQNLQAMAASDDSLLPQHPWLQSCAASGAANPTLVLQTLQARLSGDAYAPFLQNMSDSIGAARLMEELMAGKLTDTFTCNTTHFTESKLGHSTVFVGGVLDEIQNIRNDTTLTDTEKEREIQKLAEKEGLGTGASDGSNWEFVIIRPNIEHYMLGIILGISGDQLGNTLWGQTELSVYDDSQHGVWGMSYKYHERAIVFHENNLIRLWDIAYDGYNGGKDDTYVNWTSDEDVRSFKEDTMDVTRDYHGKSMMVMAFPVPHIQEEEVRNKYKTNWPSPILFYDKNVPNENNNQLLAGAENSTNVNTNDFRVFYDDVYVNYVDYLKKMPDFRELHQMRKSASDSARDDETQVDCLAFQGTMRIKQNGSVIDTINGSGHHGVDYIGVSSVRAGKGYKMAGGISQIVRQV